MGVFLVYMLKSSVCLIVLYLFYRLLMSRETFHRSNRIALLSIIGLSLTIPLIQLTVEKQTDIQQTLLTLEDLILLASLSDVDTTSQQPTFTLFHGVLIVYLLGMIFFISRHLYSFGRLFHLLKGGRKEQLDDSIQLIIHQQEIAPFSWLRYIVISEKDLEENGREILIHEKAHLKHRHTIDLLLADVFIFFQWFNPAAWLLKQEMQNIHEFEADETVINEGVNAKDYQLLLIKKAVGKRLYSMANSFNHSKLKKRITMMSKEKSSKWARMKYAFILPVAAISIIAFARPEVSAELKNLSDTKVSDLTEIIRTAEDKNVPDKMYVANVEAEAPTEVEEVPASANELSTLATSRPTIVIQPSDSIEKPTLSIKGIGSTKSSIKNLKTEEQPLYFVDGEEISGSILHAIDPNKIESITVLKEEKSIEKYGERGKNGVILISMRNREHTPLTEDFYEEHQVTVKAIRNGEKPDLSNYKMYVNGEEVDINTFKMKDAGAIKDLKVVKGKTADAKHMILMKTEEGDQVPQIQIQGEVVDKAGSPIIGAIVQVVGSIRGVPTDESGKFSLTAPQNSKLKVMMVDFATQTITPKEKMRIVLEK